MVDQLASLRQGGGHSASQNHVVHTTAQKRQQVLTRVALETVGFLEVAHELLVHDTEDALQLLLLTQTHTVFGDLATALSVHSGRVVALLERGDLTA